MPKIVVVILTNLIAFWLTPSHTEAAFEFSSSQTSIEDNEELTVNVNLDLSNSTSNNTYYLRGVLYKEGTNQYFGYTLNNQDIWYDGPFSNQACQNLYGITVDPNGDWSGEITIKANPADPAFKGNGEYLFKVSRYTSNCSNVWADTEPIKLTLIQTIYPSPSPTSQVKSGETGTPSNSPSPKSASKTPKTSSKNIVSPTPKVLSTKTKSTLAQDKTELENENTSDSFSPNTSSFSPSPIPAQKASKNVAGFLVASGIVLMSLSAFGYLYFNRRVANSINPDEKRGTHD